MPSLVVIGPQIKEKQRPKDPSLNRVKRFEIFSNSHSEAFEGLFHKN